jgi:formylglycine-generating enzyme required for sulfatase activity
VLLYELTTGRAPHRGVSLQTLPEVAQSTPAAPLMAHAPDADPGFAAVIMRCVERDPAARYASGDELREALEGLEAGRPAAAVVGNPYRGLAAFEAEHRALFFGRDPEVRAILERLRGSSFVLVTGDSGVGKSSMCRAAVLPRIEEGALGDGRAWHAVTLRPGRRPLAALAAALAPRLGKSEEEVLALADDPLALLRALRRVGGSAAGTLVLVDQLEEMVTLADPAEAARAAELLGHLVDSGVGLRLVATVRTDHLARLVGLPGLGPLAAGALHLLGPLGAGGIRQAITGPLGGTGVRFEDERVIDELVAGTAQAGGGLPLLQFALAELWEARDVSRGVLPTAALAGLGGVAGALARHGDAVIASLSPDEREAARRLLVALVTPAGTRARRPEGAFAGDDGSPAAKAARALVAGRLLVVRSDEGEATLEIAHEALLAGWGTLARWLEAEAGTRALSERIDTAAAEWDRLGRPREALFRGPQLAEVRALEVARLPPLAGTFLERSRAQARRSRRRRIALAAALPLTVAVLYGGLRLEARARIDGRVAVRLAASAAHGRTAAEARERLAIARGLAFRAFDAGRLDEAEAAWTSALAIGGQVREALAHSGRELEAALLDDGENRDVRARLGAVTAARIAHADATWRRDEAADLHARLALYDPAGTLRAALFEPARLTLTVTPADARITVAALDAQRRPGPPRELGDRAGAALPPGDYLLALSRAGHADVRYPIRLARGEARNETIAMPPAAAVPDGFVYIPPGEFLFGSAEIESLRRTFFQTAPLHPVRTGGYLVGRHEVTFAEYLAWLDELPAQARARHLPRPRPSYETAEAALSLDRTGGAWGIAIQPTVRSFRARWGEPVRYQRERRAEQDWRRFPVSAVSPDDAVAYAAFRAGRGLRGARPCTELEWERAARGADDRGFPGGDRLEPDDANIDVTYGRRDEAFGPDEVGSHPASRSPFGIDDLAGNVWEITRSTLGSGWVIRGGSWYQDELTASSANRQVVDGAFRHLAAGFRLCADPPPP